MWVLKLAAGGALCLWLTQGAHAAPAPDAWRLNGASTSQPNMAAAEGFAVQQIATTEPDRLMRDWNKPAAGVSIIAPGTIKRNQPIVTFIIFTGCRPDVSGKCNVTADFDTFTPAGAVYDQSKGVKVWVGLPPPALRQLQLSSDALGLVIENKDPLGQYRVRATITDHVAGKVLKTEQTFAVVQ